MGKARKYTPEFRREAARLVIESDRPIAQVAREIGVGPQLLSRWVLLDKAGQLEPGGASPPTVPAGESGGGLDEGERAELERLRRENAQLKMDREFLKKAAAFFASDKNR
ncbi:transposase [Kribbella sp. NPDC023855]|uniref:transposase n=2 Tax=Kribbella sp. NPDC023855 TaxID=3154698 RepID=UPI003406AAE5